MGYRGAGQESFSGRDIAARIDQLTNQRVVGMGWEGVHTRVFWGTYKLWEMTSDR